jgi:HK97 family phage major capsid protein
LATDYANLIPRQAVAGLLEVATRESVVLKLGNVQRMSSGLASIPVVSFLPVAGFVNPAYGGRKPATKIEWGSKVITAEEIACVAAIPNAFVDDAGFPIWEAVEAQFATAIAKALDAAVLFGTGAPASFPAGGIAGLAGAAQTGADALAAIDAAAAAVEASGAVPDGIAASSKIGTALRGYMRTSLAPAEDAPGNSIYGWPVVISPVWDASKGDALVGDWTYLLVGLRQDITFDRSDAAVLQDGTGAIIANAFQDDLTAFRMYMRVGVAVGQPLDPSTGAAVAPFEFADWTA